jgi:hypothetical protein
MGVGFQRERERERERERGDYGKKRGIVMVLLVKRIIAGLTAMFCHVMFSTYPVVPEFVLMRAPF